MVFTTSRLVRLVQGLRILRQGCEVLPHRVLGNAGDRPGPGSGIGRVHGGDGSLEQVCPLGAGLGVGGQSRLELQDPLAVVEQAAALHLALGEHVRIGEGIGHLQRHPCAEGFRQPAGQLLHSDAAGGNQQVHAGTVALLGNAHHDGLVGLAGFLVKASVAINHNQHRRHRPAVVVGIVLKAGSREEFLPLVENTGHHGKELADVVGVQIRLVHVATHVLQLGED